MKKRKFAAVVFALALGVGSVSQAYAFNWCDIFPNLCDCNDGPDPELCPDP